MTWVVVWLFWVRARRWASTARATGGLAVDHFELTAGEGRQVQVDIADFDRVVDAEAHDLPAGGEGDWRTMMMPVSPTCPPASA